MASFFAFDPIAFDPLTFQEGGDGVTQRRGGWLPWWMRREYMERLLEEERRLAREAAQRPALAERAVVEAEVLLESLTTPPRPKRAKPQPAPVEEPPDRLVEALTGPFQHLLNRPAAARALTHDFSHDDVMQALDMIDALEAIEQHETENA